MILLPFIFSILFIIGMVQCLLTQIWSKTHIALKKLLLILITKRSQIQAWKCWIFVSIMSLLWKNCSFFLTKATYKLYIVYSFAEEQEDEEEKALALFKGVASLTRILLDALNTSKTCTHTQSINIFSPFPLCHLSTLWFFLPRLSALFTESPASKGTKSLPLRLSLFPKDTAFKIKEMQE